MDVSLIGLVVCAAIWSLGRQLGSASVVGLIVSVAFGTTSALTLSTVGGSSPLIYLVFALLLLGSLPFRRALIPGLTATLRLGWVAWAICGLIVYSVAGAIIMPRLFAGATSAFVVARDKGVVEISLAPNAGNITQTGYFVLGALTFLALSSRLLQDEPLDSLRKGFFAWAAINAIGGLVDLSAKLAGAGDVLMPIRTATFAYLTETEQGGFWRINGTYSEASSFGGASLASLAFAFTYWKYQGSRVAFVVAALLLALLLLSTSSTAYFGLSVLTLPVSASLARAAFSGRIGSDSVVTLIGLLVGAAIVIFVVVYDPRLLDPFQHLFQTTVLDKSQSESGQERSYWNQRSLLSVVETWGLGIGFGSSRASNWFVASVSQLGIVGGGLQMALIIPFLRRLDRPARSHPAFQAFVLDRCLSACALSMLVAGAVAGSGADPGILFFIALAGILACRRVLAEENWSVRHESRSIRDQTGRLMRNAYSA